MADGIARVAGLGGTSMNRLLKALIRANDFLAKEQDEDPDPGRSSGECAELSGVHLGEAELLSSKTLARCANLESDGADGT